MILNFQDLVIQDLSMALMHCSTKGDFLHYGHCCEDKHADMQTVYAAMRNLLRTATS